MSHRLTSWGSSLFLTQAAFIWHQLFPSDHWATVTSVQQLFRPELEFLWSTGEPSLGLCTCVFAERCVVTHGKESVHEDGYSTCSWDPKSRTVTNPHILVQVRNRTDFPAQHLHMETQCTQYSVALFLNWCNSVIFIATGRQYITETLW